MGGSEEEEEEVSRERSSDGLGTAQRQMAVSRPALRSHFPFAWKEQARIGWRWPSPAKRATQGCLVKLGSMFQSRMV